jgi:hypothetical protein
MVYFAGGRLAKGRLYFASVFRLEQSYGINSRQLLGAESSGKESRIFPDRKNRGLTSRCRETRLVAYARDSYSAALRTRASGS